MLSIRPVPQSVDDDDEVFDQIVPDTVAGRVLPPTSSTHCYSHRVSDRLGLLVAMQCLQNGGGATDVRKREREQAFVNG